VTEDPFTTLGLPAWAGLTDEDVRAAWRRIAAATHPDREDGGDPDRFGAAAAAYATLRTSFGRGDALADLTLGERPHHRRQRPRRGSHRVSRHRARAGQAATGEASADGPRRWGGAAAGWLRAGRASLRRLNAARPPAARATADRAGQRLGSLSPGRGLGPRVASAAVLAAATVAAVGLTPATIGLLAGALTVSGWALWRRGGWGR